MTGLELRDASTGNDFSELERAAQEAVRFMETRENGQGLQVHRINNSDIRLRAEVGDFVFSSSAFENYLTRVKNEERTRAAFKRVLEQPLTSDPKHTRMYDLITNYIESLRSMGTSSNHSLNRDLDSYLLGNQYITLYSGAHPTLTRESLDTTPRVAVRLQAQKLV